MTFFIFDCSQLTFSEIQKCNHIQICIYKGNLKFLSKIFKWKFLFMNLSCIERKNKKEKKLTRTSFMTKILKTSLEFLHRNWKNKSLKHWYIFSEIGLNTEIYFSVFFKITDWNWYFKILKTSKICLFNEYFMYIFVHYWYKNIHGYLYSRYLKIFRNFSSQKEIKHFKVYCIIIYAKYILIKYITVQWLSEAKKF